MLDKTEFWLFIGTFVFGVFAGAYVYIIGFQTQFTSPFAHSNPEPDTSFTVTAEVYGACEQTVAGCGMYRVFGNREYRYLVLNDRGEMLDQREGLLSQRLFDNLTEAINRAAYQDTLAQYPPPPVSCEFPGGGVRYILTLPEYSTIALDACMDEVAVDSRLWRSLEAISASLGVQN
jgi:hypothetical protein